MKLNKSSRIKDLPYSGQLWTVPVALKNSYVVWIALLGLAKTRPLIRVTLNISLAIYLYARSHKDPMLFIAGCVLAELYLDRAEKSPKASADDKTQQKNIKDWALFFFALFLASYPKGGGKGLLGWGLLQALSAMIVGENNLWEFFISLGSILLVYVVSQSATLQRMFSTPLAKYLGKISFSLYCVHQPLISWFGYRSILFWWRITGNGSWVTYELGIMIAFMIQLVITVWVADLFCTAVDEPSVRFSKWLEGRSSADHR
jgi:peptidoglycan/LPS O-acetylase OafA/YrhL